MAVFRVEKTKDFTIMCNHHLRNTELSLKAKGLLSLMLSLPDNWDYTTKGLSFICKDGVDSISTALKELERHGYLTRQRLRYENGQLGDIEYTIHEQPVTAPSELSPPKRENPVQEKPVQAKPVLGKPEQENPRQLNTNSPSTNESKTDLSRTHPSIYPYHEADNSSGSDRMDRIDMVRAYREIIQENIEYGVNRNNTLHTAAKTNSISQSFPIIPVLLASFPMLGTNTMINSGAAAKIVDDISDDNPLSSKNVAAIGPNTPCAAYVSKTVKAYIK